jgi:hypothetical protein
MRVLPCGWEVRSGKTNEWQQAARMDSGWEKIDTLGFGTIGDLSLISMPSTVSIRRD